MMRYFAEIDAIVTRHGGTTEKFIGDAAMALFGVPRLREDDALRAVRAAVEIRNRLPALVDKLGVALQFRTGVNTGEVVVGGAGAERTLATGDPINVAARLEQAAGPGEILIGPATHRLVPPPGAAAPVAPLALKGKAEPVPAFRVVTIDPDAPAVARLGAPLVGRAAELDAIRAAFARAAGERTCVRLTVLGPAGVGKSRLAAEFLGDGDGRATVLRGRCLHYGEGITFWPLVEALTPLGDRATAVLDQLSGARPSTTGELSWQVRRLFDEVAAERPVVLLLDDMQWAEPALLDLPKSPPPLPPTTPILLLCLARPELADDRPDWSEQGATTPALRLEPLPATETDALIDALEHGVDAATRKELIRASAGNPLFVAEMLALRREVGHVVVPPTIQALIAARIEQLDAAHREVLECAAVEGEVFHRGGVRDLCAEPARAMLDELLAGLVRRELIRPDAAVVEGDQAYRFGHMLVRDAAYDGLPKRTRADLHQRFADWLVAHGAPLPEHDEIAGWHLEQTVRYRREIGRDAEPDVPSRAAGHLFAAGRRALARADHRAADNLLTRALDLLPAGDPRRPEIAVTLAEALIDGGGLHRLDALFGEAATDPAVAPRAAVSRILSQWRTDPEAAGRATERELPGIIAAFERAGDDRGLASAYLTRAQLEWNRLQAVRGVETCDLAIAHAGRAGDRRLLAGATSAKTSALLRGPADLATLRRHADAIARSDLGPIGPVCVRTTEVFIAQMEGRLDDARALESEVHELERECGFDAEAASALVAADIALAAGENDEAVRLLRPSYDELERLGERSYWSTVASLLADALERAGDAAEAERMARAAREASASDDLINFVITDT